MRYAGTCWCPREAGIPLSLKRRIQIRCFPLRLVFVAPVRGRLTMTGMGQGARRAQDVPCLERMRMCNSQFFQNSGKLLIGHPASRAVSRSRSP